MRRPLRIICILFFLSLTGNIVLAQGQKGLSLKIHYTPLLVQINHKPFIYYELQFDNYTKKTVELQTLNIFGQHKKGLEHYRLLSGKELASYTSNSDHKQKELFVASGGSCVLYVELEQKTAQAIRNEICVGVSNQNKTQKITLHATTRPAKFANPIILGPPLAEGFWTAVYDPNWISGHRRVFYSNGKGRYLPGRFAIDFIRVDSIGRYAANNIDSIKNWFGYSNNVLAVADGTVASVKKNVTQSPTVSQHTDPLPNEASGNYISIKIADGVYAFYEHLVPHSIVVKPGQRVKKGDVIGLLGFTGQSTGPHLHFHIADQNSRLYAEGLPYAFERFTHLGDYPNLNNFGKERWKSIKPQPVRKERPSSNSVIVF